MMSDNAWEYDWDWDQNDNYEFYGRDFQRIPPDEICRRLAQRDMLFGIIQNFAKQNKTTECDCPEDNDFDGAYDIMIELARKAIDACETSNKGQ